MGKYRIEVKKSAEKELRKIPGKELARILDRISLLSDDPHPNGSIKLTNKEWYRLRVGNYRVLYSVEEHILTVYVVKVGHRKDIYR
ncbi:MAG: type II toxin-antitoxin system RelE/ParE family toxin [Phycisphaerales bacterium]|jgi:mRNA interferase RelE/StbE|nr:type II toxin-antitoxin system RelE/ParE family toxin [Phycisphaerales bacterium]